MADAKEIDLIALSPAFYAGKRLRAGDKFRFAGKVVPKWAAKPGEVKTRVTGKVVRADTKPPEATAAAKAKGDGLTGNEVA